MTKKTRTTLFLILLSCFLVIAPSIIFYSWGYRIDFETRRIAKTGAFYFKVWPKSAQIYLIPVNNKGLAEKENEIVKKTDFFFGAVLVQNLLPKKYEIEIRKNGYLAWKKTLEIKENQVTEAKNIILMPEDIGINLLNRNVDDFFSSADGKILILKEEDASNTLSWALKILEPENNIKSPLIESKDISKNGEVLILDLKFSSDQKKILLKTNSEGIQKYYLFDLNTTPAKTISLDFLGKEEMEVFFHPQDSQKLFVLKKGVISEADLSQNKLSLGLLENVKSFKTTNDNFYYLDNSGLLFKNDYSFSRQEKINSFPFSLEKNKNYNEQEAQYIGQLTARYKIDILSDSIFLEDGQKLFMFNPDSGSFESLLETKKEPKISPDLKKVLYYSDYEIWLFYLKQELGQPSKEADQRIFIARFSEKIDEVFFLTNHYLIFSSGDKIKVAEIDDRDVINIVDLADIKSPKIFWSQTFKKLFILSNGSFYNSKVLVP